MSKKLSLCCGYFAILFPILFYAPKFMEYKYEKFVQNYEVRINCSLYVDEQKELYEFDQKLQMVSLRTFHFFSIFKRSKERL